MNKFNSKRRNKNQEVKKARAERRKAEGRPQRQDTSKVAAIARTGKGRKKLEKKWRKEQREALVAGKISLEDVATFCNPTEDTGAGVAKAVASASKPRSSPRKRGFHVGKRVRAAIGQARSGGAAAEGAAGKRATAAAGVAAESMQE